MEEMPAPDPSTDRFPPPAAPPEQLPGPIPAPAQPPAARPSPGGKPAQVMAIAIVTLISGISNILLGASATVATVLGTLGLGLICAPLTILPAILGAFEVIYAARLLPDRPRPVQPATTLAIFEIAAIIFGNALSLIAGILALVWYNDPAIAAYFDRLNTSE